MFKKVYATIDDACSDPSTIDAWTISEDPDSIGWETDSGLGGYGISKEKAEFYAKCINYCIDNGIEFTEDK